MQQYNILIDGRDRWAVTLGGDVVASNCNLIGWDPYLGYEYVGTLEGAKNMAAVLCAKHQRPYRNGSQPADQVSPYAHGSRPVVRKIKSGGRK